MKCATCKWYKQLPKEAANLGGRDGRCHFGPPGASGFPLVYETDFCGQYAEDTRAIREVVVKKESNQ